MRSLELMADGLIAEVKGYVDRVLGKRLAEIEQKLAEIPAGKDGAPGKDGIDGKDGTPGRDGKDGERGPQGEKGESGIDGKDGAPGINGKDGADGRDGKDADETIIKPLVDAEVAKAVALIPKAIDGRDGLPGNPGRDGKDGLPGIDGKDGLGFDDLSVEYDGERGFVFKFARGERSKEFTFKLPITIDRGVFKAETGYERGDGVTYGGSWWIAQKDAPEGKPGVGSSDWRLAVKRGQDGKDGTLKAAEPLQVVRIR